MIVTVTYIKLRRAHNIWELMRHGRRIKKQLKEQNCKGFRQFGFWRDIYTMTLWENEEAMKLFARSGEHKESMKSTARLGQQVRTATFEADKLPGWREAWRKLRATGKVIDLPLPKDMQKSKAKAQAV
jgi:heme-degrading monooxygenase HmoA